jgi:hypothetical protein
MHPGMSLAERREAQHHAAINQQFPQIAATAHADQGSAQLPHGRRSIAAWLSDKPVLMLNASARLADVQRFFPTAIVADLQQADMPPSGNRIRRADATRDAAIVGDRETTINIDCGRTDRIRWPH